MSKYPDKHPNIGDVSDLPDSVLSQLRWTRRLYGKRPKAEQKTGPTARQRQILAAIQLTGSQKEAARLFGISKQAVSKMVQRAHNARQTGTSSEHATSDDAEPTVKTTDEQS